MKNTIAFGLLIPIVLACSTNAHAASRFRRAFIKNTTDNLERAVCIVSGGVVGAGVTYMSAASKMDQRRIQALECQLHAQQALRKAQELEQENREIKAQTTQK